MHPGRRTVARGRTRAALWTYGEIRPPPGAPPQLRLRGPTTASTFRLAPMAASPLCHAAGSLSGHPRTGGGARPATPQCRRRWPRDVTKIWAVASWSMSIRSKKAPGASPARR